jgi:hypothetical protein
MSEEGHDYGMAVEPEGVAVGGILTAGFVIFGTIAIAVVFLFQIYNKGVQSAAFDAGEQTVAFPAAREAEVAGTRKITQFEVIDEAAGIYRIPVEHAMQLIIEEQAGANRVVSGELPATK